MTMRARQPDRSGYATNDGVRVYYEVYGDGPVTVLLMPTWALVHSRMWKMQVPYLARHFRVVTFDPRGNGRTDRPEDPAVYGSDAMASDTIAVLDATRTERAVMVAHCQGTRWAVKVAAGNPDRVTGLVAIGTNLPLSPPLPERMRYGEAFDDVLPTEEGWAKENRHYWLRDWPGYVEFFAGEMTPEAHTTKAVEDVVAWGTDTDARTMLCEGAAPDQPASAQGWLDLIEQVRCPVLAITGDQDRITSSERSRRFAELTGGELLWLEGSGHLPHVRHPVVVNHAIKRFTDRVTGQVPRETAWLFARERGRKALYVSSPIGLGHVLRDLAIARALRQEVPDLRIEWLAQDPVTRMLEAAGEIIHPASGEMSSESAHWESEATGHDLHAFDAFRRMDEILCANYLLFDDVVRQTPYDPRPYRDPAELRRRLGYPADGPLLAAAAGGTAVGRPLLELIAEGFAYLRKDVPEARMVMVTGPRIDPRELPDVEGLEKVGFLPDAFAHLAAADAAVVQGGLSTTMELVAAGRPFVYFPIARHWEQQHFVAHRLRYYRAGIPLDYAATTPARLAAAMRTAMRRRPRYRPLPTDGATRTAHRIASLLTG